MLCHEFELTLKQQYEGIVTRNPYCMQSIKLLKSRIFDAKAACVFHFFEKVMTSGGKKLSDKKFRAKKAEGSLQRESGRFRGKGYSASKKGGGAGECVSRAPSSAENQMKR